MDLGGLSLMDLLTLEQKISKMTTIITASKTELVPLEELTKILGDNLKANK